MKTAVIVTTIRVPKVLELYRALDSTCDFFVVGDRKTPHAQVSALMNKLGNAVYYSDRDQEKLGYRSSGVIGWNKIMRRNIALLEAMRSGAEIILSVDDDNIPLDGNYFREFRDIFKASFNGLCANSRSGWFNVGAFLDPGVTHRGFPQEMRNADLGTRMEAVTGAKVGVAAGMWLGDPDIDAVERLVKNPLVYRTSPLLQSGLVVAPGCYSPFNTQNTAIRRELAALFMVWVGVGRYDDIWASYLAQRIMREEGYHVHYGKPWVWQERNPQDSGRNLDDERFGMKYTLRFCEDLERLRLGRGTVVEKLGRAYEQLRKKANYLPPVVFELGKAWLRDVEKVRAS